MKTFEISDSVLNNIFVFLDRVDYRGLKEIQAINEIMQALNHPMSDENPE